MLASGVGSQFTRQVLFIFVATWFLVGTATSQQPNTNSGKQQQINELITLEYLAPHTIEPSLSVFMSPTGRMQSIPAANAIMVIDSPENVAIIKKHIEQIEQIARARAEKERAERKQSESRVDDSNLPKSNKPSATAPARSSAELMSELQALRADSRRLLDLLEKKATRTAGDEHAKNLTLTAGEKPRHEIVILRPNYLDLDDAVEICNSLVEDGVCRRTKDRGLVLVCAPERIEIIRRCILELDVEPTYVMVKATLCQVKIEELESSGIVANNVPRRIAPPLPHPTRPIAPKENSHEEQFELLKQKCPSLEVLANPTVLVFDGQDAVMNIVSEIPVQQLTQTEQGGSIGTTTFREAGIRLGFVPKVNQDGLLTLNINSELSAVRDWTEKKEPIIDRRQMITGLRVSNGETTMVVGLGRGLRLGLRPKKPTDADEPAATSTEAILIVTAKVMQSRHAARTGPTPTRE